MYVVGEARKAHPRTAPRPVPEFGAEESEPLKAHRAEEQTWRWVPDPAESETSPTPVGKTGPSDGLIRALTRIGLHYWR